MIFNWVGGWLERTLRAVWSAAEQYWKQTTKPDRDSLLVGGLADLTRGLLSVYRGNWKWRGELRKWGQEGPIGLTQVRSEP